MNFHDTNLEEKVRDIDFTNPSINRMAHYTNILSEQSEIVKDNGVIDFSILTSSDKIKAIDPFSNQIFL